MKKCKHFYNTTLGPDSLFFCGSVSNLYPFISTRILTVENEYDHNQLFTQMGVPAGPPFLPKTKEYIARCKAPSLFNDPALPALSMQINRTWSAWAGCA